MSAAPWVPRRRRTCPQMGFNKPNWSIADPRSTTIRNWDMAVVAGLVYTCFITPYDVAFAGEEHFTDVLFVFNRVVDILFAIDILINFNMMYYDESTSKWVTQRHRIVWCATRAAAGTHELHAPPVIPVPSPRSPARPTARPPPARGRRAAGTTCAAARRSSTSSPPSRSTSSRRSSARTSTTSGRSATSASSASSASRSSSGCSAATASSSASRTRSTSTTGARLGVQRGRGRGRGRGHGYFSALHAHSSRPLTSLTQSVPSRLFVVSPSYLTLAKYSFTTLLLAHWMACMFHLVYVTNSDACNWVRTEAPLAGAPAPGEAALSGSFMEGSPRRSGSHAPPPCSAVRRWTPIFFTTRRCGQ